MRCVLLLLCLGAVAGAELTIPITADTCISTFTSDKLSERSLNAGGGSRLKLKGLENLALIQFDTTPLRGQIVSNAVLHLRGTDDKLMVARVGLSTVASPWNEGQSQYSEAKPGEATYLSAGQSPWAGPGSCFLDVIFSRGGTIWSPGKANRDEKQWYHIPVDSRLLEACAAELSYGLALSDDNGQTMNVSQVIIPESNRSNNYFYSREQSQFKPYLTASVTPATAPAVTDLTVQVEPWAPRATFTHGAIRISWASHADESDAILGYRISLTSSGKNIAVPRWLHPTVVPPGAPVQAIISDLPSAVDLRAQVEVIARGGVIRARGIAIGTSAAALTPPKPITLPPVVDHQKGQPSGNAIGSAWIIPDLTQAHPLTGNILEEPGIHYRGEKAGTWSQANPVWSGAKRTATISAARGEWVAVQCVCASTKPTSTWSIRGSPLTSTNGEIIPASALRLSRAWYQQHDNDPRAWYADPLIPLNHHASFTIPDAANAIAGQTHQTVYAEWFIPPTASPGRYQGTLHVHNDAGDLAPIQIILTVGQSIISTKTTFTWSMNAYHSPGTEFGKSTSAEFIAAERDFYRVAHEHRTTLAVLGYSHAADFQDDIAWPLTGAGSEMRVADWTAWDKRFGPLFDGSAFADTPRSGVPLDHFYLPFMESYPTPMAQGYRWNDVRWEDHWRVAGSVDDGFNKNYREQWIAVMRDVQAHIKTKSWSTSFQVYLNDKYFYKQYDDKKKKHGRGTSFWLLDEPQHIDDFLALRFFGRLIREAQGDDRTTIAHRVDVSRPQWGRDVLDRVVDINVSGGFSEFPAWLHDWHDRHGQRIWTYGGAPSPTRSAIGIAHQALDLYARGVDGFVPWLTIGSAKNWTAFEITCVIYSGKDLGIIGACPSLRLKAYRRGEQDVSLLQLFAHERQLLIGDPRRQQIAALIGPIIRGARSFGTLDGQGAVTELVDDINVNSLETLRQVLRK